MSRVSRVYWENPEDPSDNGWAWTCNVCGKHGQLESEGEILVHTCTKADSDEAAYWEKFYEDMPTDEELEAEGAL